MNKMLLLFAMAIFAASSTAFGFALKIPDRDKALLERIEAVCKGCSKKPMIACGDRDVGYGEKFFPHFYQGNPAMGYLIIAPAKDYAYRKIREGFELIVQDGKKGEAALKKAYENSSLITVSQTDGRVSLTSPEHMTISIPEPFVSCLKDRSVACPEKIDPPELRIFYGEASRPQDQIVLRLTYHGFDNKLFRPKGRHSLAYFCFNEGRATLE